MASIWQSVKEELATRYWYRSLDAVITAPLDPIGAPGRDLHRLLRWRGSHYERVRAAVHLGRNWFVRLLGRIERVLTRFGRLPLRDGRPRLLAYGSGATVFLAESGGTKYVLKVYRRSLGRSAERLRRIAREYERAHRLMDHWFNGPVRLVPQVTHFVCQGPLLGIPAVAALQAFVGGEKRDLLTDFSAGAIRDLVRRDADLAAQVRFLVERSVRLYETHRMAIDMLGRENVLVAQNDGRWRLWLIDNTMFDLGPGTKRPAALCRRAEERLASLRRLVAEL